MQRENLPELTPKEGALLKKVMSNPVLYAETVVFDVFDNGLLEIHNLEMSGYTNRVKDPKSKASEQLKLAFLGKDQSPEVIKDFLTKAFRRPVDNDTIQIFLEIHDRHLESGHSGDEAMRLVIRNALIAPQFLYRSLKDGQTRQLRPRHPFVLLPDWRPT